LTCVVQGLSRIKFSLSVMSGTNLLQLLRV
jgi:hypothetical protein